MILKPHGPQKKLIILSPCVSGKGSKFTHSMRRGINGKLNVSLKNGGSPIRLVPQLENTAMTDKTKISHLDYVMMQDKEFIRGYIEGLLEEMDVLIKRLVKGKKNAKR